MRNDVRHAARLLARAPFRCVAIAADQEAG
jgi:hypothetical protein